MHQNIVRCARIAPVLLLCLLARPAGASAQLAVTPCHPAGFSCGTLDVPLDYGAVTPGVIHLAYTTVVNPANTAHTAVLALVGGPGQSGIANAEPLKQSLAPLLGTSDLLIPDQRGTGKSGLVQCKGGVKAPPGPAAAARCAQELGSVRGFFTTADSIKDIDALRAAGGYDKLTIFGVSYGTKVAEDYAAAYPDHVQSLVLDSVEPPDGPDALSASSFLAMPRVLDQLCTGGLCNAITPSASGELSALAAKLRAHPLGRGKTKLDETTLADLLYASDMNPLLYAALPAALHDALDGDPALLLRAAFTGAGSEKSKPSKDNATLLYATGCEDAFNLPFARNESPKDRATSTLAAIAAEPTGAFGPFSAKAAAGFSDGLVSRCLGWAFANPTPPASAPLPPVPTLLIEGQGDIRTNVENAQAVATEIGPTAHVLQVPFVGHSATTNDQSGCVKAALAAFAASGAIPTCDQSKPLIAPLPLPPVQLGSLPAPKGVKGRAGRTLSAVVLTLADAKTFGVAAGLLGNRTSPGLRGGRVTLRDKGRELRLSGDEYVRGVKLTGALRKRKVRVRVSGSAAAHGVLTLRKGVLAGRLGGHRVKVEVGS